MTQLQWTPVIYLPADLTVRFGADVLTAGDPGPWCQHQAARLLGPDADRKQVSRLAHCLRVYAAHFRSERTFGETEMTETEVPAGPALRVHRYRKLEPAKRRTRIVEELDWIICPSGSTQAVMMSTTWDELMFSKAAISIADDMAENFRIKPEA